MNVTYIFFWIICVAAMIYSFINDRKDWAPFVGGPALVLTMVGFIVGLCAPVGQSFSYPTLESKTAILYTKQYIECVYKKNDETKTFVKEIKGVMPTGRLYVVETANALGFILDANIDIKCEIIVEK